MPKDRSITRWLLNGPKIDSMINKETDLFRRVLFASAFGDRKQDNVEKDALDFRISFGNKKKCR